ncbi:type IX secretion system protein PorQ [Rhodocytophaga aerolata]|uniref:Type IX secretion system protein PorQ n=1 Tax=Rhodocytophaga aerolata TaxID=455078 RepID=A0ABT8R1T3_9BACT|nr:type IX secretion system protein PorQ [Rhodocytophaga aerolata]MDO1446061.1 type IX secretion system protein PorQ [Rhodocytophaga aerolata]
MTLEPAYSQHLGGRNGFAFLRLPTNAPQAALGGSNLSLINSNVNLFTANPALLNTAMHKHASFNFVPYYTGVNYSTLTYAHKFNKAGRWGVALQYLDYGSFEETDATGAVVGSFQANDFVVTTAHARSIGPYTVGMNVKLAGSTIAEYNAYGLLLDMGGVFKHPEHDLTIGLLIKNAGFAFKSYTPGNNLGMPFDVQVGTSFKPEFMPLRFSFTAHHLHTFDIAYDDPAYNTIIDQNGNQVIEKISFTDKLFRHFVFGTEILLSKAFQLQAGYNHLVRQEMKLENRMAGAGLSFGASLQIKAFQMAYSRAYHHAAGGVSYLTLISNFGALIKKKESK